jgi:hypothetical protein
MEMAGVGDSLNFAIPATVQTFAPGTWRLGIGGFYSVGNPQVRFDLLVDGVVIASAQKAYVDAEGSARVDVALPVTQKVGQGARVDVRLTMTGGAATGCKLVINAGPIDGRESYLRAPILR